MKICDDREMLLVFIKDLAPGTVFYGCEDNSFYIKTNSTEKNVKYCLAINLDNGNLQYFHIDELVGKVWAELTIRDYIDEGGEA